MKRLAWIFIALFCTALAQVQPVASPGAPSKSCGCCQSSGACGMRDCAPAPAAAQPVNAVSADRAAEVRVRRQTPAPAAHAEPFYAGFVAAPAAGPGPFASLAAAPVANVPLFKAHCRFLL